MNMALRSGSIYGQTARFDDQARALTEDELFKAAPSIFATTAHESRSARFKPIATIEVLRALQKEGFSAVGARQSTSVEGDRINFTKHMIRLRRLDDDKKYRVGDTVFEMLLKNGNDGSCAWDLLGALWRIACLNSLVSQTDTIESVKVRHTGDVAHKVVDGTYKVLAEAENYLTAPQDWPQYKLERAEREAFAKAAHVFRFEDTPAIGEAIPPVKLLECRRQEDTDSNLWNVFNVVQENMIKGGQSGQYHNANNKVRRITTRPVEAIDTDVKLNKALFVLASEMAKLKAAA